MKKKIILLSLLFLTIDIISKYLIDIKLLLNDSIKLLDFFYITKVYNYGASWNLLNGKVYLIIIISLIMLYLIYLYMKNFKMNKRNILAFSLTYAGIIGNLVDRIFHGYVIDFIDIYIFDYNYPVFNFADIWIVTGICLIIIAIIKKEDNNECSS